MIDIHSHLLFSNDDGAQSMEESLVLLKDLAKYGYHDIILTPHYIKDSKYSFNKKTNLAKVQLLKKELLKQKIDINLYLGNEIYIDRDILSLLENGEISSLNDSQYLLIELPISGEYAGYEDVCHELIDKGYIVILAHPERYIAFQKDFSKVKDLLKMGILLQSNLESILGSYGKNAQKMVKKLFKEHMVSFLATDMHHKMHYRNWEIAKKKIIKIIGDDEYLQITSLNAQKIIKK